MYLNSGSPVAKENRLLNSYLDEIFVEKYFGKIFLMIFNGCSFNKETASPSNTEVINDIIYKQIIFPLLLKTVSLNIICRHPVTVPTRLVNTNVVANFKNPQFPSFH